MQREPLFPFQWSLGHKNARIELLVKSDKSMLKIWWLCSQHMVYNILSLLWCMGRVSWQKLVLRLNPECCDISSSHQTTGTNVISISIVWITSPFLVILCISLISHSSMPIRSLTYRRIKSVETHTHMNLNCLLMSEQHDKLICLPVRLWYSPKICLESKDKKGDLSLCWEVWKGEDRKWGMMCQIQNALYMC